MQRLRELDSLRGLAAFTVVIHHFLLVIPAIYLYTYGQESFWQVNLLKYTLLHLLWAGHEAVIFFFILSGFVLSLPFLDGRGGKYSHFLIKRVCRIYLPYCYAITIAIVLDLLLSRHGIAGLSDWFNATWTAKVSKILILKHYLFLGSFDNAQFDPVIWSLIQEMRISLFFPFLVYLAKRVDWKIMLGVSLLVYNYVGYDLNTLVTSQNPKNDILTGGQYLIMFVIGILLAKHQFALISFFKKIPPFFHYELLAIALLLYVNRWILLAINIPYRDRLSDLLVCVGVCIIMMSALASVRISIILHYRPLTYLGEISYSLYLFHAIILLACINLLYGHLPLVAILCMAFITTLVVSTMSYRFVECPAIALGKVLTRKRDLASSTKRDLVSSTTPTREEVPVP